MGRLSERLKRLEGAQPDGECRAHIAAVRDALLPVGADRFMQEAWAVELIARHGWMREEPLCIHVLEGEPAVLLPAGPVPAEGSEGESLWLQTSREYPNAMAWHYGGHFLADRIESAADDGKLIRRLEAELAEDLDAHA